jgi:hypothetical protein
MTLQTVVGSPRLHTLLAALSRPLSVVAAPMSLFLFLIIRDRFLSMLLPDLLQPLKPNLIPLYRQSLPLKLFMGALSPPLVIRGSKALSLTLC